MNIEWIIKSENEIDGKFPGYWHNEDGWCDYPDSATIFNDSEVGTVRLPIGNAVSWVILSEEQKQIENFDKGDFILRLFPNVGRECLLTYCCPECGCPVVIDFRITREALVDLINKDSIDELKPHRGCRVHRSLYIFDITHVDFID